MFIIIPLSPVAFDMEWRFYFVERGIAAPKRMVERRTAVVQIADSNGFILVIQIYGMNRTSFSCLSFILSLSIILFDSNQNAFCS
jgi:hypothetical protein